MKASFILLAILLSLLMLLNFSHAAAEENVAELHLGQGISLTYLPFSSFLRQRFEPRANI